MVSKTALAKKQILMGQRIERMEAMLGAIAAALGVEFPTEEVDTPEPVDVEEPSPEDGAGVDGQDEEATDVSAAGDEVGEAAAIPVEDNEVTAETTSMKRGRK